ncbi:hypothetical protein XthCFBP4691_09100 [Xanthomonas theicola]|uniref:Carrier domain-containing protein n=2 Tax=Xanthomonas theicola TaxID=56464 RepID=A0A2S6ZFX1_9XANT|nr:hypothetical protein XthCFBP4691_09100 [Xanthomonas theicola]
MGDAIRAYYMSVSLRFKGALDIETLQHALDALVARHESLRTTFVNVDGELFQEIAPQGRFYIGPSESCFDLETGPLIRGRLTQVCVDEHVLDITVHHIVSDAWSIGVLTRELIELYGALDTQREHRLPPVAVQYADYAHWVRQQDAIGPQLDYWRERLRGLPPDIDLPTDRPSPVAPTHRGESVELALDEALTARVKHLAQRHELTLYMVLCTAWAVLLSRISGHADIAVGTQVAGRARPEMEGTIGVFVNSLVLRVGVDANARVDELLQHVKAVTLGAYDHQDVPFDRVVEALQPPRSVTRNPLYQVMFVMTSTPRGALRLPQATVSVEFGSTGYATVDLLLLLEDCGSRVQGTLDYAVDLFNRDTTERWRDCFLEVLRAMVRDPDVRVGDLGALPPVQRRQVLEQFNATCASYPRTQLLHELFEEQVARTPQATALIHQGRVLTYAQLDARADRLAARLHAQGVGPDRLVAVQLERGADMVIALLGVLKAGGAYLPIDPALPHDRQAYMREDAAPAVVLTDIETGEPAPVVALRRATPLNLAYVIYTSGSTGKPKGVMIQHESVVNFLSSMRERPGIESSDVLLAATTLSFDIAGLELLLPLLHGATVVLANQDARQLLRLMDEHAITMMQATPVTWRMLIDAGWQGRANLKALCGGEALTVDLARQLIGRVGSLWNLYGPTETTIWSCVHQVAAPTPDDGPVEPIGRPIANTRVYVLDSALQPVPIGVTGEIFIAGDGLARGYLNRPALTAERFLADPFASGRMYRTGDLGRWRADGALRYLGRNDRQVKIRGFRIEIEEIEACLRRDPRVKEAVVLPAGDSLVAYLIGHDADVASLREGLRAWLPDYMIPNAWRFMERFPLTPSGKVDRSALPALDGPIAGRASYVEPRTEAERTITDLWAQVLKIDAVGVHDNFFELGGHSMLALRALYRINEALRSQLTAADLYRSPTAEALARRLDDGEVDDPRIDLQREARLDAAIVPHPGHRPLEPRSILLTGATGFVGRFLLAQLLHDTSATVHCLVRARSNQEASTRLRDVLTTSGLWQDDWADRVVAVPGDLRAPRFDVEGVDTVYHCATRMNHLEAYASAKLENVAASEALLRYATERSPKIIHFISTLDVFSADTPGGAERRVAEHTPIDHEVHRESQGYTASKWVSEKLFLLAQERGIPCNIFRLGLVWADAQQGRYDPLQREDRILRSCLESGYGIQDYHYDRPPIPVDYLASAVVRLANKQAEGGGVFHVAAREQMREGVFERCNAIADTNLELLPLYEWTRAIQRLHLQGRDLPIVPLIEPSFALDEDAFYAMERAQTRKPRFDCARTHDLLEREELPIPALNDDLLRTCVRHLLSLENRR